MFFGRRGLRRARSLYHLCKPDCSAGRQHRWPSCRQRRAWTYRNGIAAGLSPLRRIEGLREGNFPQDWFGGTRKGRCLKNGKKAAISAFWSGIPELMLAPELYLPSNGGARASHAFARGKAAYVIDACGRTWARKVSRTRREQKWKNGHGSRSCAKSARHFPQSRPQEQNTSHHLPGERGQIAGRSDLVRQFLRAVAKGRTLPARLQACDFDDHAGSPHPVI